MNPTNRLRFALAAGLAGLSLATAAQADRRFSYSYEAKTYTPGSIELETWTTWKTGDDFDRSDDVHQSLGFGAEQVGELRGEIHVPIDENVRELVEPERDWGDDESESDQPERLVGRVTPRGCPRIRRGVRGCRCVGGGRHESSLL